MMLSQYTTQEGTRQEREARELSEFVELCTRINDFIVRMSGSYAAAVELLEKHGVPSRLNIEELNVAGNPMDILSDLALLKWYLEDSRDAARIEAGEN